MNIKNEKQLLISVIIPCYNSEKYIASCIHCLQGQSYISWEAIFINDGSIDNSLEILNEYASKDNRIKVYTQQNRGAAKAREYGISKATGTYLTFLDVDDTLTFNALEVMSDGFNNNIDIVVSGFNILKNNILIKRKRLHNTLLENLDYLKNVLTGRYGWELCSKMYRKSLFDNNIITPSNIRIGEDAAIFIQLICHARQVKVISDCVYNYIQYNHSASHVKSLELAEETLQAAFFIEELLKRNIIYVQVKKEIDAMFLLFYSNSTRRGYLDRKHPLIKTLFNKHFTLNALCEVPLYKALYIVIFILLGRFLHKNSMIQKILYS